MPTDSDRYVELQNCLDLVPVNSPVGKIIEFQTMVTGRKLMLSLDRGYHMLCDECIKNLPHAV